MACLVALVAGSLFPTSAEARIKTLRPGRALFWDGPLVENADGKSFTYRFKLPRTGVRLRVGVDHPQVGDSFDVTITEPSGDPVGSFTVGPGIYSEERVIEYPETGKWRVKVTPQTVTDSAFRVRAKLEARLPFIGRRKTPVLPNLQILPPHDASFLTPVTNGTNDQDPTGAEGGSGCHSEEHAEDQAVRCLRFGFGVRNTGLGPMDLLHRGSSPVEHELFQIVHRANGTTFERPAGLAVYHKTHAHFHHDAAVGLQLFNVTDRDKGALEAAGDERTKGFAHRNELLRDWDVFYPTIELTGMLGLKPGWADIYEWDRPGNYIDFGLNPDGYYVLRMQADPVDGVLESNEQDNFGYTYIQVTGSTVELLEAGRGRDPWDPCKIEVGLGGFPDPKPTPRPASCPPDTT